MTSEFRYSSEGSKTDATISNIPSTVDILEEDVSENPKRYVMGQPCLPLEQRTNSLPVRVESDAAPATQVLEPSETGPRLNEVWEMLTVFPPTSIEIGVLKLQGTNTSKINTDSWPTSCARQRTRVNAGTKLRCRFGTTDRLEKFRNAVRVTDNLCGSSVEDGCCSSDYGLSVHRDTVESRLPVTLINE